MNLFRVYLETNLIASETAGFSTWVIQKISTVVSDPIFHHWLWLLNWKWNHEIENEKSKTRERVKEDKTDDPKSTIQKKIISVISDPIFYHWLWLLKLKPWKHKRKITERVKETWKREDILMTLNQQYKKIISVISNPIFYHWLWLLKLKPWKHKREIREKVKETWKREDIMTTLNQQHIDLLIDWVKSWFIDWLGEILIYWLIGWNLF